MIDEAEFDDAVNQIAEASDGGEDSADPLAGLVEKSAADPGAAFAPDIVERLAALKKGNPAAFELLREDRDLFIAASNGHVLAFERSALARLEQDRFIARTKQGWLLAPVAKQAEVRA